VFCFIRRFLKLCPRLKLGCLSRFISLLGLTLTYNCTEFEGEGIRKREPCAELQEVLPEAGEDYEGSGTKVLHLKRIRHAFRHSCTQMCM
jgi:hypothetical protein